MKTILLSRRQNHGSVILMCLCIAAVLGVLLASALVYTHVQNVSVNRSQNWNAAIVLSEAGVEEALSHLNRGAPFFDPANATNNLTSNGWTDQGNGVYSAPRRYFNDINTTLSSTAGGIGASDYYDVSIRFTGAKPMIYATGYVHIPLIASAGSSPLFANALQVNPTYYQSRNVRVDTKIDALFSVAMAAIYQIDLKGKNITTDSFDSADPNYSDNGMYPMNDITKTKDNGDVVTDGVIIDTLSVGNAKIKGRIKTGPGGTATIGPNGSVGTRAWVEGGNTGIQDGHYANDMNVAFPVPTVPSGTYYFPPSGNIGGTNYNAILGSGNYYLNSMGNSTYRVIVTGEAKLWVLGNINYTGNDILIIAPGGSLKLYMSGSSAKIGGNGIVNQTGNAANFIYYGTSGNTTLEFNGNANFTGAIYAPNADFTLGGGGSDTYDFVGASVSKNIKMNGHFRFHYDENLARVAGSRGFIPTNWAEN